MKKRTLSFAWWKIYRAAPARRASTQSSGVLGIWLFSADAIATRREARASLKAPRELVAKGAV